ncbi:SpoIIE family protein phosphatase [Pelosinus sp. UFO1]|uniref:SpoIIE family protein phosphatase n=1 Tax=Pelosinus sp. UFO1 TaxID=484770 RepID=UPI0004D14A97|nr:SpoIIE family protein phosphatase [Pelosinus sp. UFO1]AIF52681.1 putative PAS/PAC sensor protein [Pelosinus sp. UFO1]
MSFLHSNIFGESCGYCQRIDLLNMINDPFILIDFENGKILFMNRKALDMYQYSEEECLTKFVKDISHNSARLIQENLDLAKKQKDGYVFTANHIKKDGSIFKVEISSRYMSLHGKFVFAAVVRNLTSNGKMREEIQLAGKVQRRLLPRDTDNHLFRTFSIYQPANYISGDLYDYVFQEESQKLYGIVIDVMGHGLAAAFQTNLLKYLFLRVVDKKKSVKDKLAWMNKEVMPFFTGGEFAGVFLFEFDFTCNTLTYSAGGINYFISIKNQKAQITKAPGIFLGIKEGETFDQDTYSFQPGEGFLFLTDGLFERFKQPLEQELNFESLLEMCEKIVTSGECRDDATGLGIMLH